MQNDITFDSETYEHMWLSECLFGCGLYCTRMEQSPHKDRLYVQYGAMHHHAGSFLHGSLSDYAASIINEEERPDRPDPAVRKERQR